MGKSSREETVSPDASTEIPSRGTREGTFEEFWRLWRVHHEYLYGLSLRWMRGNHADAEDALSSAKLRAAHRYLTSPGTIQNERAWLSRILYNVCMDCYRRWDTAGRGIGPVDGVAELDNGRPSAQDEMLAREMYVRLSQLLDELPQPWRTALVERFFLDRSYKEIAARARTTEANIRKRVQLARRFLRGRLDLRLTPRAEHELPDG
jgi:RNA polymerase sigma factor (sigma-70 family)